MIHPARGIVLVLAALTLGACAGGAAGSRKTVTSRDVLTREQIDQTHAVNAYDAVMQLRSVWLRQRGSTQMPASAGGGQFQENPIWVYLDDQRLGDIGTLRTIEAAVIHAIRFYPPAEAAARWGFNHGGGVISVHTRP